MPDQEDEGGAYGFAACAEEGGDVVGDVHVAELHVVAETEDLVVFGVFRFLDEDGAGCDVTLALALIP